MLHAEGSPCGRRTSAAVPRRFEAGDVLAGLGAVCLLVALFLSWFGNASAWEAFETLDLVLLLIALAAIAALLVVRPWLDARVVAPLGALALLIVVVQLVEPPPAILDDDLGAGVWVGLAGAVLLLLGGLVRTSRLSISVSVGERDVRPRVPSVDRRQDAPTTPIAGERDPRSDRPTEAFPPVEDDR